MKNSSAYFPLGGGQGRDSCELGVVADADLLPVIEFAKAPLSHSTWKSHRQDE